MQTKLWSLALAGLCLSGLCLAGPASGQEEKEDTKTDQVVQIEDRLTDDDPKDRVKTNSAHKVHVLKLKAGQMYQVDLMKKDRKQLLDPYLRIETTDGKQLAADDDSGGFLNARIMFTPPKDDDYRLIATCLFGTGEYVLKVTPQALGKLETVGPKGLEITGKLARGAPAPSYRVKMSAGKTYIIDLESNDFDTVLVVRDMAGKQLARDDDGGDGTNSRLRFSPPKDDTYVLGVQSFGGGRVGEFSLKVRAIEGKGKEVLKIDGKLDATDNKDSVLEKSPAKTFQVRMTKGKTYTIDLRSDDFDAYLRLENPDGKQVAEDDDSGGNLNALITYAAPADGMYRVIATCLKGTGAFTLRVQEN